MPSPAEFLELVKTGEPAKVAELLAAEPALAGARDGQGRSALFLAAMKGRTEVVEALLAAGAKPDLVDCCAMGDLERARTLVEQNRAAAAAHLDNGFTPLHMAAYFGNAKIARLLVRSGADLESVTKNKMAATPLQIAAMKGALEVIELFLASGADVESRKSANRTPPLVMAAQSGSAGAVGVLLDGGANLDAKDEAGKTALAVAREAGHEAVVALLQGRGAK
ncbi:MAG: ankyrin repeat domain-containing protein [Planctomycetes bacterium]|nr:ankyrin repeat domain-containing protein [Planctomycetota bacterium]